MMTREEAAFLLTNLTEAEHSLRQLTGRIGRLANEQLLHWAERNHALEPQDIKRLSHMREAIQNRLRVVDWLLSCSALRAEEGASEDEVNPFTEAQVRLVKMESPPRGTCIFSAAMLDLDTCMKRVLDPSNSTSEAAFSALRHLWHHDARWREVVDILRLLIVDTQSEIHRIKKKGGRPRTKGAVIERMTQLLQDADPTEETLAIINDEFKSDYALDTLKRYRRDYKKNQREAIN